jgi:glycosyltransferase involved in cell wall biosynthesis
MSDLVSIVIPTYNRAHCLGRAVDSALQQSHAESEIIVVDDGSTDGTGDFVLDTYRADRRVRYVRQENKGVAAARNRGLAETRGDFVAFLDSDDLWKPWKLELQLACLRQAPSVGMVWTDMEAVDADGAVKSRSFLRTMYTAYRWFKTEELFAERHALPAVAAPFSGETAGGTFHIGDIFSPMVMGNLVHTSTALLRRDRLARVHGFDEELRHAGEDYDFHLRTCREGPVGFIDLASITYQIGMPDQLSKRSYWMARNFLTTLTRTLERDRERIVLPRRLLDEVIAHANSWMAETLIPLGDLPGARRHFRRSLRHKPWQPRALAQLALCQLSPQAGDRLRRAYGSLKARTAS